MSKGGKQAGSIGGAAAGYVVGAKYGAETGSIFGPIGAAVGSVIGMAIGGLFGDSPNRLGPKKRAAFIAAGGTISRGRYFYGAERVGIRGARRIINAAAAGNVVQFPKQPKKRAPPPPPPPRQPGAVATGVGVGAGAAAAQAVLQSLPPAAQWVWNELQQRWELRGRDLRKGPGRRYRRRTREELISENLRRQIERARREGANAAWTGRVTLPSTGGVKAVPGNATLDRIIANQSVPLEEIKVTAKRLPVPAPVQLPAGYRLFRAATRALGIPGAARYYNYIRPLAPIALVGAKSLLGSSPGRKRGRQIQEQLTQLQQQGLGYSPSYSTYTAMAPLAAAQPATAKRCKCKPCPKPKKRGPRKPRAVCYAGTFTERRNGLSKSRRRQVPCR